MRRVLSLVMVLLLVFTMLPAAMAQGGAFEELQPTAAETPLGAAEPTAIPEPTATAVPTTAPTPAATTAPTPAPSAAPTPTATAAPTATPAPTAGRCTLTEGCTLPAGHEGDCVPAEKKAPETLPELLAQGGDVVWNEELTLADSMTVPAGTSLSLTGRVTVPTGLTLRNEGTLRLSGVTEVYGTISNAESGAMYINAPSAELYPDAAYALTVHNTETAPGRFENAGKTTLYGLLVVQEGASLTGAARIALEQGGSISGKTDLAALPHGFAGMPAGYVLSEKELADKAELTANNVPAQLESAVAGEDYVEGQIVFWADSAEYAETVAAAYSAALLSYAGRIATAKLSTATVPEAVAAASDAAIALPAVDANYIVGLGPSVSEALAADASVSMFGLEAPEEKTWEDFKDGDPFFADPTDYKYQWMHDMVNTYEAWSVTEGSAAVKVAVIDSGVMAGHEELSGRVTVVSTTSFTGFANDNDEHGHGTHCAGIIAAAQGNHAGGSGIAPRVSIESYRVLNENGRGKDSAISSAIVLAADRGVDIISMSLGGYFYDATQNKAVQYAVDKGVTVIVAMGNDGSNTMCYPAGYDNVVAVSAVNRDSNRAAFSNYGAWADVSAPGVAICSTKNDGGYVNMSGTSMATPVVAGVAALYMSVVGHVSPAEMEAKLKSSVSSVNGSGMGTGIVDAAKLFSIDRTKPEITVWNGTEQINDLRAAVPYGARLKIEAAGTNGAMIVYTTNGKAPTVKDGIVTEGIEYTGEIDLSEFAGKRITVKAACISGMGVVSYIASQALSVELNNAPSAVTISGSNKLTAGRIVSYTAKVAPDGSDQKVTWSIVSQPSAPRATITATGVLRTYSGDSGIVTIRATSAADTAIYGELSVTVDNAALISSVTLSTPRITLSIPSTDNNTAVLSISKLTDTTGTDVTADADSYSKSWTSSNVKVATVDEAGLVTAVGRGSATITCKLLDGSSRSARSVVIVQQLVEELSISGQSSVAPGRSASYRATVQPNTAKNRAVEWSLEGAPEGVSINASGRVTVSAAVEAGQSFTVKATAKDGGGAIGSLGVEIQSMTTAIAITSADKRAVFNSRGVMTGASIYTTDINAGEDDSVIELSADVTGSTAAPLWTSSNERAATVDQTGKVTAVSGGRATISCAAQDGSNKRASVTITVVVPASYLTISSTAPLTTSEMLTVMIGRSVQNRVSFGDTYGTPTNRRVTWDYSIYMTQYQYDASTGTTTEGETTDWTEYCKTNRLVTVNSSGTLTVSRNLMELYNGTQDSGTSVTTYYRAEILQVRANAADGSGATGSILYKVSPRATTYLRAVNTTVNAKDYSGEKFALVEFYTNSFFITDFSVSSSDPKVASFNGSDGIKRMTDSDGKAIRDASGNYRCSFWMACNNTGSARVTVKANDGSNRAFTVTVRNLS